ncbi:hypothetical protein [Neomoorella humiferrea]|nr:hypothetical protein [Moorella humiferrea]
MKMDFLKKKSGGIFMKNCLKKGLPIFLVIILIMMLFSNLAFAAYKTSEDQKTTIIINSDKVPYTVTITNGAREEWTQYDRFDNRIYYHISDGFVVAGLSFPFDIYADTSTYIKSNGVTMGTIAMYEWEPRDVLKPRWDYLYYGGEVYKDFFLPIEGSVIDASVFYGFQAFDDAGLLGGCQDYNNFNLW